jgi:hypothetical protein
MINREEIERIHMELAELERERERIAFAEIRELITKNTTGARRELLLEVLDEMRRSHQG